MADATTPDPVGAEQPDQAQPRRRLGVMGGTFDPIHNGHLVAASEVQSWFDLDEVVFVPTGQPYQKSGRGVSDAEHRYLMTVIATASNPRFTVSRVDIDRDGPTYTIDTLRDLATQHPQADLYFITGADVGRHPGLAGPTQVVRVRPLRRLYPPRLPDGLEHSGRDARRSGHDRGDPRAGDLVHLVPGTHRSRGAGLVPGA